MSHGDCAMFVVVVERWNRKVGGGWIVGFFFFFWLFAVVGGCRLRSGGRRRLLGARLCARACVCVCFFSPLPWFLVVACGLWGNDSSGYCYCVVMVFVMVVYYYFDELFILF